MENAGNVLGEIRKKKDIAATTIQNQVRNYRAKNKFWDIANAKEQEQAASIINKALKNKIARKEKTQLQAASIINKALKNRIARKEKTELQRNFNPIDYQDALRRNKKTFKIQVYDYTERRSAPLNTEQAKRLRIAQRNIESINQLTNRRKQTGRPPGGSSRLSTATA
jgi:hypothetical protein